MGQPFFAISKELFENIPSLMGSAGCQIERRSLRAEVGYDLSSFGTPTTIWIVPNVDETDPTKPLFDTFPHPWCATLHWLGKTGEQNSFALASLTASTLAASGARSWNAKVSDRLLLGSTSIFRVDSEDRLIYHQALQQVSSTSTVIWPPQAVTPIDNPKTLSFRRELLPTTSKEGIEISRGPAFNPVTKTIEQFISLRPCTLKGDYKVLKFGLFLRHDDGRLWSQDTKTAIEKAKTFLIQHGGLRIDYEAATIS